MRSAWFFRQVKKMNRCFQIRGVKFEPPQNGLGGPIFSKDTVCRDIITCTTSTQTHSSAWTQCMDAIKNSNGRSLLPTTWKYAPLSTIRVTGGLSRTWSSKLATSSAESSGIDTTRTEPWWNTLPVREHLARRQNYCPPSQLTSGASAPVCLMLLLMPIAKMVLISSVSFGMSTSKCACLGSQQWKHFRVFCWASAARSITCT